MSTTAPIGFRALPLPLAQLSLAAVLRCGQSFRWNVYALNGHAQDGSAPTHEYRLCLRDRVVCLRQTPTAIFYRSVFPPSIPGEPETREAETLAWIRDYFQLDIDLVELYRQWSLADPVFQRVQDRFEGIRMLRQDPFENLISFICSSNNNISRITKMVKSLCSAYSPPLLTLPLPDGNVSIPETYHPFPPPSVLAAQEVAVCLRGLGFGYRADFIQKTAAMLVKTHGVVPHPRTRIEPSEDWLLTLRNVSTADARGELVKFMGVGRKVADCILLMSLDKREVIPVDTHVHQIAVKHYGLRGASRTGSMSPKLYEEVATKLAGVWGDYAGWAHSILFTSDLRSFSSYGLPALSVPPTPSTPVLTPDRHSSSSLDNISSGGTPFGASMSRSNKRKRAPSNQVDIDPGSTEAEKTLVKLDVASVSNKGSNLADRVKRRRRGMAAGLQT